MKVVFLGFRPTLDAFANSKIPFGNTVGRINTLKMNTLI